MNTLGRISFLVALLAASLVTRSASAAAARGSNGSVEVCETPECLTLSALITSNMNQSADPCEDFNAYACGHYPENNLYDPASITWASDGKPLLMQRGWDTISNKLSRRVFEMLFYKRSVSGEDPDVNVMYRLAGSLFRSCSGWLKFKTSRSNLEAAKIFFNGILAHLLEGVEQKAPKDWLERVLGKMVRVGYWTTITMDPLNTYLARRDNITAMELKYHAFEDLANTTIKTYTDFFASLSTEPKLKFGDPNEFVNILREIKENVTAGFQYNSRSVKYQTWSQCRFRHGRKSMQYKTIPEMNEISKCIDVNNSFSFSTFFESILDGRVDNETRIYNQEANEFQLFHLFRYLKERTTSNKDEFGAHFSYLIFDWLLTFAPFFPAKLAAEWEKDPIKKPRFESRSPDLMPVLEGQNPFEDCLALTKKVLGPILERMFQRTYHEENFEHVRQLANRIQNATIENVKQQKWITSRSKDAIIDKIESINKEVGYDTISAPAVKMFYASTIRSLNQSNNSVSFRNFGVFYSYALCAIAGKRNNWLSDDATKRSYRYRDTFDVNAFNVMTKNQIVFPMGILSPFLYHISYPEYMNLGGIGSVMGHEIGHGFDDTGHKLTKEGANGHFWDNETESGYLRRMKCVESRYKSYELVPGKMHDNSKATLGNDIADIMGISSAFAALKLLGDQVGLMRLPNLPDGLSPEKLFFVQAAQVWCSKFESDALLASYGQSVHSPAHIRIRGIMENSRDFAEVFQCKPDQAMNPRDKCEFW